MAGQFIDVVSKSNGKLRPLGWTLICVVCQLLLLRAYAENYRGLFNRFVYG